MLCVKKIVGARWCGALISPEKKASSSNNSSEKVRNLQAAIQADAQRRALLLKRLPPMGLQATQADRRLKGSKGY